MTLVFDIETNGLLRKQNGKPALDRAHCILAKDTDGTDPSECFIYHDSPDLMRHGSIEDGLRHLSTEGLPTSGHNVMGFDAPALRKLYPQWEGLRGPVFDTLVSSRLMFPWIGDTDYPRMKGGFPGKLIGSHSLEAWGWRLGLHKGDYPESWEKLTPDMLTYCARDVEVTATLLSHLERQRWSERSLEIEHEFASNIDDMTGRGVWFDIAGCEGLTQRLSARRAEVEDRLRSELGTWTKRWRTPKRKELREKVLPVEPGSRMQVAAALGELYGWKPSEFTNDGRAKLDESVISRMDPTQVPIKDDLMEFFMLQKRLGQVAEGKHGWLKSVTDDHRIHGYVNHNGAYTGRCTHSRPNVAQTPRVGTEYGAECRALFSAPPGRALVGADMSGIEARLFAHYLHPYDQGAFVRQILSGDVHTQNMEAIRSVWPSETRQDAKNHLYAAGYGAKARKVGAMVGSSAKIGGKILSVIQDRVTGLETLVEDVQQAAKEHGFLIGLDGRRLRPPRIFSAFNTLIQSGGAVVMKLATNIAHRSVEQEGLDAQMVIHCHDEYQWECDPADAARLSGILVGAIEEAGRELKVDCPLTGESKEGRTWAETH